MIFTGYAEQVVVPGVMGDLGILPRHAPLLTRLRPGLARVIMGPDQEEVVFVCCGFLEVQPYHVTVLADSVLRTKDMDEAAARAAKERAEQALRGPVSPADYARIKAELQLNLSLLRSIAELRGQGRR
jgi:F-type H+-transporting ATPase subunit epsilon